MEKSSSSPLVFATSSDHKLRELRAMLGGREILGLRDIGIFDDIPEDGDTLEDNAIAKARYLFEKTGESCLAEDTGLEVTSLGGVPGVKTARYAGEERNMERNMGKLLSELSDKQDRTAQFRTIIAYVSPEETYTFEGIVRGHISFQPYGKGGFGYDPVFVPEGFDVTFAAMSEEEKNRLSHRARAVQKLLDFLIEKEV